MRYEAYALPSLTVDQESGLKRLAMCLEEDIDLSDITEITEWSGAREGCILRYRFLNNE